MSNSGLKYVMLASVFTLLGYLTYCIAKRFQQKKAISEHITHLPTFEFRDLDNKLFSSKNLASQPVWLLYFNTECEFCQIEINDIQQHITQLSSIKVVLISSEKVSTLKKFSHQYGLDTLQNLVVVQDSTHFCVTNLGMTTTPSSLLYATNGQLIKKYSGKVKVETIINDQKNQKTSQ